jgi:hypothetical protein
MVSGGTILIIVIVIIILVGIGVGLYFYFKNQNTPAPTTSPPIPTFTVNPTRTSTPTITISPTEKLTRLPGKMMYVSVGVDGLSDSPGDNIWTYEGVDWYLHQGHLEQISVVTVFNTYGCNFDDLLYHWNGNGWGQYPQSTQVIQVSTSLDGTLVVISPDHNVWKNVEGNNWMLIGSQMRYISVGNEYNIWAIDVSGKLHTYIGSTWYLVDSKTYRSVAATADDYVWLLDSNGNLGKCTYTNNSTFIFNIMYPRTSLIQISAQNSDRVVGVDASQNVYSS